MRHASARADNLRDASRRLFDTARFSRVGTILPYAIVGLTVLLCVASTACSLQFVLRAYHGALLWDEWDSIGFFARLREGTATLQDFIRQHNEHRILVPRLVFALDLTFADARNTVNFASILICQALHVCVFHRIIAFGTRNRLVGSALTAFAALMMFSAVQYENLVWAFQIPFTAVFLFFTTAALMLSLVQAGQSGVPGATLLTGAGMLLGAAAALVMANGAAALICIAVVLAMARPLDRLTAATAAAGIALLIGYAATFTPHPGHTPLAYALQHPLILLQYTCAYLGSAFAPLGLQVAILAGGFGLAFTGFALFGLFTGRLARNAANLTLAAVLVFIAFTAGLTALGRSGFGVEQATAGRYATPSAILTAAAVSLTALWLAGDRRGTRPLSAVGLVLGATLLSVTAAAVIQYALRDWARLRVAEMSRATAAILSAVHDESALRVLFPDVELMKQRIPLLQAHKLNMFSLPSPWPLGAEVPHGRLADPARCYGSVDLIEPVPGVANAFQLKGWAWDRAGRRPPERLVVLSAARRVVGYGSTGWKRPDVPAAVGEVSTPWVGAAAYARDSAGQLGVYGVLEDGHLCPIGGARAP